MVCATDAGREGQLIFMRVYIAAGCKKPVRRLWISSMTDEAIRDGFRSLKDNAAYHNMYLSAKCRSEADWLVGLNATRLYSVTYNDKLTLGRVQTPTLAMIVQRQKEIDNFVSVPFYEVEADCGDFRATWRGPDGSRIMNRPDAEAIVQKCSGKPGIVTALSAQKKSVERPRLYDLNELQRDANRLFGYTAMQTLNIAQSLYETQKLTTYPRTDSRYLTTDMKAELPNPSRFSGQTKAAKLRVKHKISRTS